MSDRILCDGEIEYHGYDQTQEPILTRLHILSIMAIAFCFGLLVGIFL